MVEVAILDGYGGEATVTIQNCHICRKLVDWAGICPLNLPVFGAFKKSGIFFDI
jgi:hypothetical protein